MAELEPVPGPPGLPLLGNLGQIDKKSPSKSFHELGDKYGDLYRLQLPGKTLYVASSVALFDELCDERRFEKNPQGGLGEVRNAVHDGLFTARPGEQNWDIAHRVLTPAFGTLPIRDMFDEMYDVAAQMTMKWARLGGTGSFKMSDEFTRLALDTLALCSMGYRFNSFYSLDTHPFLHAMNNFLFDCGRRPQRLPIPGVSRFLYGKEDETYFGYVDYMRSVAKEVMDKRVQGDDKDRKDLLFYMLDGVDRKTGRKMTPDSVIDNLLTLLVAGHETTSGLLGFAMYQLLKKPETYRKVQEEVDTVIGNDRITADHMSKLPYMTAVFRETLRLNAPIAQYAVEAKGDTILSGKYALKKGDPVIMLLLRGHLDPAVYGDNAKEFVPERMLDESFNKLPKNAWKPWGNGTRGCIGRPFAMQEAKLAMAMMFQMFDFEFEDPTYELKIKQNLTLKPDGLLLRPIPRHGRSARDIERMLSTPTGGTVSKASAGASKAGEAGGEANNNGKPMTIVYGGNAGTCECLAKKLAANAAAHGFNARTVDVLDDLTGKLSSLKDQPVVMVTTSYEGQPADNAAEFVPWLESLKDDEKPLEGLNYAMFGCGNHEWVSTFHRIPKIIDAKMQACGAKNLTSMGLCDVAEDNVFGDFESWEDDNLWPALKAAFDVSSSSSSSEKVIGFDIDISRARPLAHHADALDSTVVSTHTLTADGSIPTKKHVEIKLPEGVTYKPGDHLSILPFNSDRDVHRALRRFGLTLDSTVTIRGGSRARHSTQFVTGVPVSAKALLAARVELHHPATKRNILMMAAACGPSSTSAKKELSALASSAARRPSVLELLERYPDADISFGAFLAMLPLMRKRTYCISSSPLVDPSVASITFSLIKRRGPDSQEQGEDAEQEEKDGSNLGVASHFLSTLQPGDKLGVTVRSPHTSFSLPQDQAATPIIMVAAGSGIAPFRSFIQHRAQLIKSGEQGLSPAILFYGCREPGRDDLYADDLAAWEREGAVVVQRAYSRTPELSSARGAKHVQDAVAAGREMAVELWRQGAKLYVCGPRSVAHEIKNMAIRYKTVAKKNDIAGPIMTQEEADAWWEGLRGERHVADVFD